MEILINSIFDISRKMISLFTLYIFFMMIISVIPMTVLVKQDPFSSCMIKGTASKYLLSKS